MLIVLNNAISLVLQALSCQVAHVLLVCQVVQHALILLIANNVIDILVIIYLQVILI